MRHSKLRKLCRGTQCFLSLKSIDLSHSKDLIKTPDLAEIPDLEILILEGCSNLVEIPPSLGRHQKLVTVDLKGCRNIKTLPRKFEMNRLETFVLSGCSKVRKLPEFGKEMERLSKLDLEGTAIAKLPESLGNLIGLVELNLKNCKKLVCFPCNVRKLKALKIIRVCHCSKHSRLLLENFNESETLEVLDSCGTDCEYNDKVLSSSSWSCFSVFQRPSSPTNLFCCNLHDVSPLDGVCGSRFVSVPCGRRRLKKLSMRQYGSSQQLWDFIESFQPQQVLNLVKAVDLNIKSAITTSGSQIPYDFFRQCTRTLTIPGSEVPSWFYNQNYLDDREFRHPNVSFIISRSPHYCDSGEWWGIAICLVIENDFAWEERCDKICWTFGFPNHGFPNKYFRGKDVYLYPSDSHQISITSICCSYLVVDGLQMTFFSMNAINNKSPAFKIKKCGWRAVGEEDVEAWRRTRDKDCSSNISEVDKNEGYTHCPRHDDQLTERKIIVEVGGTYSPLNHKAACGGILTYDNDWMIEAFLLKITVEDTLTTKLWGCLMGLKRAWDAGFRDVILRSDSTEAVHLIKFEVHEMHKDIDVIMEIKRMLGWNWCVDVLFVYRDSNGIANLLAKRALDGAMGLQILGTKATIEILKAEKEKMSLLLPRNVERWQNSKDEVDIHSYNFNTNESQ